MEIPLIVDTDNIIWSHSKVDIALSCPYKYYSQYPPAKYKKSPSFRVSAGEGRIGSAVHSTLETLLRVGTPMARNKTRYTTKELLMRGAIKHELTLSEMHVALEYIGGIDRFVQRHFSWRERLGNRIKHLMVEKKVGISKDFTPSTFWPRKDKTYPWFRMAWDLASYVVNKDLTSINILDHKTGAPKDSTDSYEDQCRSYAVAALVMYPDIDYVQFQVHYPATGEVISRENTMSKEEIRDVMYPWLKERVEKACTSIKTSQEARKDWYCNYCNFKPTCPTLR